MQFKQTNQNAGNVNNFLEATIVDKLTPDDLDTRFCHHPLQSNQSEVCDFIRSKCRELAGKLVANIPASREQSLAITHLEEVVFWANAAIARHSVGGK